MSLDTCIHCGKVHAVDDHCGPVKIHSETPPPNDTQVIEGFVASVEKSLETAQQFLFSGFSANHPNYIGTPPPRLPMPASGFYWVRVAEPGHGRLRDEESGDTTVWDWDRPQTRWELVAVRDDPDYVAVFGSDCELLWHSNAETVVEIGPRMPRPDEPAPSQWNTLAKWLMASIVVNWVAYLIIIWLRR